MEAAHTPAQPLSQGEDQAPPSLLPSERRCLVTGDVLPKTDLCRFVVGPDQTIVPDLAENLPGRGLWVKAEREAITTAASKGLFSKAAKASVKADPALADQVAALLRSRCLNFMGLAKKAGLSVLGQSQVETALRAKKINLLLLADDASATLDNRYAVPECHLFSRDELGASLGYAQIVYAGLTAHGLTNRLKAEINKLAKLTEIPHKTDGNG